MTKLKSLLLDKLVPLLSAELEAKSISAMLRYANFEGYDFAMPFHFFLKKDKALANSLIKDISTELQKNNFVDEVKLINGFLNFKLDYVFKNTQIINDVLNFGDKYGSSDIGQNKKVIFEYSSPNIGKPLHVGHIRSTILGDSLSNIFEFTNHDVFRLNYLGDSGLHLGKVIYALNNWNDSDIRINPEKKILDLYVKFSKEEKTNHSLKNEAQKIIKAIENKDETYLADLHLLEELSLETFKSIYKRLGVKFDQITGQSKFANKGKEIISEMVAKKLAFEDDDGGIKVDLSEFKLPNKIVLRSDGTAVYATQDMGAAVLRKQNIGFDEMYYVVGNEQKLYFQQIFSILNKAGFSWYDGLNHIPFGLINLEDGKMSSREGDIVYLSEVLDKSVNFAGEMIESRSSDIEDKENLAEILGIGSVKYAILSTNPGKDILFSWDRILDYSQNSSVYVQYAYARANSILNSAEVSDSENLNFTDSEANLVTKLNMFPEIVAKAKTKLNPSLIPTYIFDLCSEFNSFYANEKILTGDKYQTAKLKILESFQIVVKNSMNLLGIKLADKM